MPTHSILISKGRFRGLNVMPPHHLPCWFIKGVLPPPYTPPRVLVSGDVLEVDLRGLQTLGALQISIFSS